MRKLIPVIAILIFAVPTPAFAYLDPGTGSMIVQGIIAAITSLIVAGKLYWNKIVSFFSGTKNSNGGNEKDSK